MIAWAPMNVQVTIIGLLLILAFYACVGGILVVLGRKVRSRFWRYAITIPLSCAALALPWIDELRIASSFREVCKEAGAQIPPRVVIDGYYDETTSGTSEAGPVTDAQRIEALEKSGYVFSEGRLLNGKISHVQKIDGRWHQSVLDTPTARHHFKKSFNDADAGHGVACSEDVIVDSKVGQTIAKYRYCKRYASYVESLWMRFFGRGPTEFCPAGEKELKNLLPTYVFAPSRKK